MSLIQCGSHGQDPSCYSVLMYSHKGALVWVSLCLSLAHIEYRVVSWRASGVKISDSQMCEPVVCWRDGLKRWTPPVNICTVDWVCTNVQVSFEWIHVPDVCLFFLSYKLIFYFEICFLLLSRSSPLRRLWPSILPVKSPKRTWTSSVRRGSLSSVTWLCCWKRSMMFLKDDEVCCGVQTLLINPEYTS